MFLFMNFDKVYLNKTCETKIYFHLFPQVDLFDSPEKKKLNIPWLCSTGSASSCHSIIPSGNDLSKLYLAIIFRNKNIDFSPQSPYYQKQWFSEISVKLTCLHVFSESSFSLANTITWLFVTSCKCTEFKGLCNVIVVKITLFKKSHHQRTPLSKSLGNIKKF